ncbi:guanylate kinase [Saccharicrinis sp. FJH54]|uniref:guanylate kinase n=1 Tax=Saccharicrinis sp. FJH54 TaxID=3344665 RepID=UPI0035D51FF4
MKSGKLIIFSAPSGSGKTTLVKHVLSKGFNLEFSISATSRNPRGTEENGKDYYFLSPEEFRKKIDEGAFLEWEEVYSNTFYGTLKSEVDRITANGNNVVFDVDVVGGLNIKSFYGERALAVFVQPPSVEELEKRLESRGTDDAETIKKRIDKAEQELSYAGKFDVIIINDNLDEATKETEKILRNFLN